MDEFVAWLWDVEFWHWWALAVALVAIEVFVPSTLMLWPAASAFVLGVVLLIEPDVDWRYQLLLFAVLAVASSLAWAAWGRKHPGRTDHPKLNVRGQRYVGRRVALDEPLQGGRGRVRIDDTWWNAKTEDGADLPAGGEVEVTGADGITLVVRPAQSPT